MKNRIGIVLIVALVAALFLTACNRSAAPAATSFDVAAHKQEIEKWQKTRLANLTKEDGWLSLIGLFWLNEGENKFGSSAANPVVLPKEKVPAVAGSFWLDKGHVRLVSRPGVEITSDGKPVTELDLRDDNDDNGPSILKLGSLLMDAPAHNLNS